MDTSVANEASASGVSWAAVLAGAFVAAALAFILLLLGVGLGLASVSPWTGYGASAGAIGLATILWLFLTQGITAGVGGYVAGRLRTKWAALHTDEVYFRDTAHGLLAWAVGIVIGAAILGTAATSIVAGTAKVAATTVGAAAVAAAPAASEAASALTTASAPDGATSASAATPQGVFASSGMYLTDELLRGDRPVDGSAASAGNASARAELGRILAESMRKGALGDTDRGYAARVIAAQTGMSPQDAEKRVDAVYAQAKSMLADAELAARTAADNARKALAKTSLWMFVALLFGAFCASLAATVGGRQRDGLAGVPGTPSTHQREVAVGAH
ncbi:MAG: hypothetical protein ABI981_06250 [Betaproteobacteria bacterium]